MGVVKRIGQNQRLRGTLCWLAAQYIRLVGLTGRWTHVNRQVPLALQAQGQPMIITFWHARLLMLPKTWVGGPLNLLISQHRDGQLIARTVAHFGFTCIAGSSTRGGAGALRGMLKALKSGESVGITPDGPRGPRMRASLGVINLAKLSGAPLVPLTCSCPGKLLRSWDRFLVPFPFAKGIFIWGEPIHIPRDMDDETARQMVEDILNRQQEEADRQTGLGPVEPAPAEVAA